MSNTTCTRPTLDALGDRARTAAAEAAPTVQKMAQSITHYPTDHAETNLDRAARFLAAVNNLLNHLQGLRRSIDHEVHQLAAEATSPLVDQITTLAHIQDELRTRILAAMLTRNPDPSHATTVHTPDGRITISPRIGFRIINPDLIPPAFLSPDPKRIEEAIAAGRDVPGVLRETRFQLRFTAT